MLTAERPAFVFFDQSTGEIVRNSEATAPGMGLLADEADPAYLFGIDGDAAYWRDQRGLVSFDLDSETAAVVDGDVASGFELLAVEDGWLATSAGDHGTDLEGNGQRVRLPDVYASVGFFSPDARWASFDADQPEVFESATGQPIVLDLDVWFATGYDWLDAETLVVLAADREQDPVDLVTCVIPAGTCEVAVADVATFEDLAAGYALPIGERLPG